MKQFDFIKEHKHFCEKGENEFEVFYELSKRVDKETREIASITIPKKTNDISWYIIEEKNGKVIYDATDYANDRINLPLWFNELLKHVGLLNEKRNRIRKIF